MTNFRFTQERRWSGDSADVPNYIRREILPLYRRILTSQLVIVFTILIGVVVSINVPLGSFEYLCVLPSYFLMGEVVSEARKKWFDDICKAKAVTEVK